MATFNDLVSQQSANADTIRTTIVNMKKDSTARKTSDYVQKRKVALEQLWEEFDVNNAKLLEFQDYEHDYFKNKFYDQVQKLYNDGMQLLKKYEESRKSVSSNPEASAVRIIEPKPEQDPHIITEGIKIKELLGELQDIKAAISRGCNKAKYEHFINRIEKRWDEIRIIRETILSYGDYEDSSFQRAKSSVNEVNSTIFNKMDLPSGSDQTQDHVMLPKITIPSFEGNYESWTSFHDIFKRIIHNNDRLGGAEKMQYLKTHLKGEASRLIQHLEANNANYESAWQIINDRYNNTRLLLAKYLDKIINQPTLSAESASGIKQLHDTTMECLQAIANLGIDTGSWGPMVEHIITRKLDKETGRLYEQTLTAPREVQSLEDLLQFLETRFQSLESLQNLHKTEARKHFKSYERTTNKWAIRNYHVNTITCAFCNDKHYVSGCYKLLKMSALERINAIKRKQLCTSCLTHKNSKQCQNARRCGKCNMKHHTLLHLEPSGYKAPIKDTTPPREPIVKATASHSALAEENPENVITLVGTHRHNILLATALIKARTVSGTYEYLRALVDSGSQASFITQEAAQLLNLPQEKVHVEISGLGTKENATAKKKVTVQLRSRFPDTTRTLCEMLVLPRLTKKLPEKQLPNQDCDQILLADPSFNTPGPIDVILGADIYKEIIMDGVKKLEGGLLAQNTAFGWVLSGNVNRIPPKKTTIISMVTCAEEDKQLEKFWEIEEVETKKVASEAEEECQEHYNATHVRNTNGTYTVRIPFKKSIAELGESKKKAIARLLQLEKRFNTNKTLGEEYRKFMQEYLNLKHMVPIPAAFSPNIKSYYIPHQAVIKEDSSTTKLRVVFDASAKTSTGVSLNELQHSGPRLQQDLKTILLRWRKHRVALTADVEKMYRQIKISEEDQDCQRIVWRFSPSQPIEEYKLTTVTYGTTSAPYLAVRTLQQLAEDEKNNYPGAAEIVLKDFYVDDLMSGAETYEEALYLQQNLINLLKAGGFTLRKWSSNNSALLESISEDLRDPSMKEISDEETKKTLGIHWNPTTDAFKFQVAVSSNCQPTKRIILSEIARLFDPLGWLAPIIIKAKIMIQELWMQQVPWDQPVPAEILNRWQTFREELPSVEKIIIPRWVGCTSSMRSIALHGFCDASEKAYGAVIYSKIIEKDGTIRINLLTAKSKVAPIKTKKTLPRLELCAAALLAKLFKETRMALDMWNVPMYAWSDSTIALSWIKGGPEKWKDFVANRVAQILEVTEKENWYHVKSEDNPADVVSRGVSPAQLQHHPLWWSGPTWLRNNSETLTKNCDFSTNLEEKRKKEIQVLINTTEEDELLTRFSTLQRLVRVATHCNRFVKRCRGHEVGTGGLTTAELRSSLMGIIRRIQGKEWAKELISLQHEKGVEKRSNLFTLNPFKDSEGIIRVGGRLQNSGLSYDEKHPILVPRDCHLARLIVRDAHLKLLHGGNQTTAAFVRRRFWIINAKGLIRQELHNCRTCLPFRGKPLQPPMGNLPTPRVSPSPPFSHTGIDYAGPIQIRSSKGRGHKSYKGYIAVFVCLATKAVHLEAVSDMTTNAFLAALRRFTSRRGICNHIYSDNGTTFVGADKVLQREVRQLVRTAEASGSLEECGIRWHFIPPAAPHFGGIWEAAVKSTKYHLRRIIGDHTLTYEELTTLLCQVEACLNSRPLCPLTTEPSEVAALTPGHFLIGREIVTPNEVEPLATPTNALSRWKLIQKLRNDFWKIWSREYLYKLQQRPKWNKAEENIEVGDLVLQKEEDHPASKWPLARVVEVHPGADGVVRVATVKTKGKSVLKRPITKLIPLPKETQTNKGNERASRRTSGVSQVFTIILTMCALIVPIYGNYTIKYPSPGLFIEEAGVARISRGQFRISVTINNSDILEDERNINHTLQKMATLCKNVLTLTTESHCPNLIHHLEEQRKQILWGIRSIQEPERRKKRGLLGQFLTSVFGVNDEVFRDIEALDKNQQELIQKSDHQTKLMLSTMATINETEIRIYQKLASFRSKLNEGLVLINNMRPWYKSTDDNKLNIHILTIYQLASNYLEEMGDKYTKLINARLNRGHILELLTPVQLSELLLRATSKLPPNLEILSKMMPKMEEKRISDKLQLLCYFHIVERMEYTLIKPTPIPTETSNGSYVSLDIPPEFVAIDYNGQTYFEVSEEEVLRAESINRNTYLCSPNAVHSIENNPHCIIDEIYQRLEKVHCKTHQFTIQNLVWKQLYTPNTWLFVSKKPTQVALRCSGTRQDIIIQKVGIIQITPDCTIHTRKNILTTQLFSSIPISTGYIKPMEVNINTTVNSSIPSIHIQLEEPVLAPSDQLQRLQQRGMELQGNNHHTYWHRIHKPTTVINLMVTISILLLGGIMVAGWRYWARKKRTTEDQHKPFQLQPIPGMPTREEVVYATPVPPKRPSTPTRQNV